jgi:hypothetical protein
MPEIKFNTAIYKKEAIAKAIKDYSDLAQFVSLKKNSHILTVKIKFIASGYRSNFIDEFKNYALALTKKCL